MKLIETGLPGVMLVEPTVFADERGFFYESHHEEKFAAAGLFPKFVQTNLSRSAHGVLRGLHYQLGKPQGKLICVPEGEVFDVAVDIRPGSAHFGDWVGVYLGGGNHRQLWIPEGFAHGICVLSETALVVSQYTDLYFPEGDAGIRWDDPEIGIDWPIAQPSLSAKDSRAPLLAQVPGARLPA